MNKVPQGYKQTEVGVIPVDWNVRNLADLSSEIGDGIHSTPNYVDSSDYYFVNGNNLINSQITVNKDTKCVSENEYLKLRKKLSDKTILLSINGTIGNLAFFNNEKVILGKSAAYISLNESISKFFIYYILQDTTVNKYFKNELTGTTIRNLSLRTIRNTPIPLPPLPEQIAIAEALSDTDALIGKLEELITKKRKTKQGAMQELLTGKKRLPGFSGSNVSENSYKKTEIGLIPSDWGLVNVNDITTSHRQGFYTKENYVTEGTYLVRITDLLNPKINFLNMPKLNVSKKDFELYKISIEDFLFARSGAIGRYGIVYEDRLAVFGSYIIRFTFNNSKIINEFFGFLYETQVVMKQLLSITQGSSNININANNIKLIKIPLPTILEQTAIAAVLSDMDAEIEQLERKLEKYKMVKTGMMQELLTGKTRLI